MKIKISAHLGLAARSHDSIDVDDDATEDEIERAVYEHITENMLDFGWEKEG